jgi:hypothetical protein
VDIFIVLVFIFPVAALMDCTRGRIRGLGLYKGFVLPTEADLPTGATLTTLAKSNLWS